MRITVKLYGNLKKHMPNKQETETMEIEPGTRVVELLARLNVPDSAVWMSAINDTVVAPSTVLHPDDLLEVFEPVGGG